MKSKFSGKLSILSDLCIIGGLVLGVILANEYGVEIHSSDFGFTVEEERNWLLTICWFVVGFIIGVVEYVVFGAFSELLLFLEDLSINIATINDNKKVKQECDTKEGEILKSQTTIQSEKESKSQTPIQPPIATSRANARPANRSKWKCSCGEVHADYVIRCSCGKEKVSISDETI